MPHLLLLLAALAPPPPVEAARPVPRKVDPAAADLLVKACATARADAERWRESHGEGRVEWTSADGSSRWSCDLTFDAVGRRLWLELTTRDAAPDDLRPYDPVTLAADGAGLISEQHAPEVPPHGVLVRRHVDGPTWFMVTTGGMRIDPRTLGREKAIPTEEDPLVRYERWGASLLVGQPDGRRPQILIAYPHAVTHIDLDPDLDYRPVRVAVDVKRGGVWKLESEWTYRWERELDGTVVPREIVRRWIDLPERVGYEIERVVLDVIRPKSDSTDAELEAFYLESDARVRPGR